MNEQQQLYGLMAVTEEQQKAVQQALDELAQEKRDLQEQNERLARMVGELRSVVAQAAPNLQKAATAATREAVSASLANVSGAAAKAVQDASGPMVGHIETLVGKAAQAEQQLNRAVKRFGNRWTWTAAAVTLAGSAALIGSAWGAMAWQRGQIGQLSEQRLALKVEVDELAVKVKDFEKRGARIVFDTCGGRLCVEVSRNQGKGRESWDAQGWRSGDGKKQYLIPSGY